MTLFAVIVAVVLGSFTLRRYVFWAASLLPRRAATESRTRSVVVLVAACNEAQDLPRLLAALEASDYPAALLDFVVVSDGSSDATPSIIASWAARMPRARAIILPHCNGKSAALQAALAVAPRTELVTVLDADTAPEPVALARLAGAFEDARVGAACGYPDPGLHQPSMASKYAALERWVSHLVTFAGKDRLGLAPPVIGAFCCVRAEALAAIGGFPQGSVVEDIHLSMAVARAGWKTRWVGCAVARENVPGDLQGFRLQRLRWSRGLMASWTKIDSVENLFVAAGYLDRLAFAAGVVLALLGRLPVWIPLAFAAAPLIIILTALWRAGAPGKAAYLCSIIPMTLADLAVTFESALAQIVRAPLRWKE